MKGSGALRQRITPLPQPTIARKQERRKYYIMRQLPFQAISEQQRKEEMRMGKILDAFANENHIYQLDVFKRGFHIAVLLLIEVFAAGKDEFILSQGANE